MNSARIQSIKQERDASLSKKMEIAMKNMIEKEKLKEILLNLHKTPQTVLLSKIDNK